MTYEGKTYFALDGSYGDATEILIVDTDMWTEKDWEFVSEGDDSGRSQRAQEVIDYYESKGRE